MTLGNIKSMKKDRGFTIVELLIVIVVIAILAAITIVAYNGVQKRANASAAQSGANILQKKAEAYNASQSSYPVSTSTTGTANFNSVAESSLIGSGLSLTSTLSAGTGKTQMKYEFCILGATAPTTASTATGARISYWDYNTGAAPAAPQVLMGDAAGTATISCTTAT